jgi:hypothetical protein
MRDRYRGFAGGRDAAVSSGPAEQDKGDLVVELLEGLSAARR